MSLSKETLETIEKTLPAVAQAGTSFTSHFYKRMFSNNPQLLNVFNQANQRKGRQQKALFDLVAVSATCVLKGEKIPQSVIDTVANKHCALNVLPEQYSIVGENILGTIAELLTDDAKVLAAWKELYGVLSGLLIGEEKKLYDAAEKQFGGWRGARDFVVVQKVKQSDNVTMFSFAPKDGKIPLASFEPGQYITVWPKPKDHIQPRHYSLTFPSSTTYNICVRKIEDGLVSTYLHDKLNVGDEIKLSPPFGNYTMTNAEDLWTKDVPIVLISAGIGMTPVISILDALRSKAKHSKIFWFHSAKNSKQHPFSSYLIQLGELNNHFTRRVWFTQALEEDKVGNIDDNIAPFHFKGRIDLSKVKDILVDTKDAHFFVCGPVEFMKNISKQLTDLSVPEEQKHFEIYGPSEKI